MKKIILCLLVAYPLLSFGQIGVKAGLNFSNVTNTSSISHSNATGYNIGIFLAPKSKSIISSKTELILSKQGYNYSTNSQNGSADLLYIMLPTYMCINITRFFQIHIGAQMAYLINAPIWTWKNLVILIHIYVGSIIYNRSADPFWELVE